MRHDAERFGLVLLPERRAAPAPTPRATGPDNNASDTGDAPDYDDGPGWPDDAAESAFLSENTAAAAPVVPLNADDADEADDDKPLPPLETLVARIPQETREMLEELFRARFVAVKKIQRKALKNGTS
jgi:hypothetical protein